MTERSKLDQALTKAPGGLPAGTFTAKERAKSALVLSRRFPGFVLAAGRSKADAIGDLVEFLLTRQGKRR